jgi:hypothetical protein
MDINTPASGSWWQWPTFAPCEASERISSETSYQANRLAAREKWGSAVMAELVPDPDSKYDPQSIRVDVGGIAVGYIYQSTQDQWNTALRRVHGSRGLVRARIYGPKDRASVAIDASTTPLDPARGFLSGQRSLTVKVASEHHSWLNAQVPRSVGAPASLLPRDGGVVVVVGGYSVGTLSKKSAEEYGPVAAGCIARGSDAGCWMLAQTSKDGTPKFQVKVPHLASWWLEAIQWEGRPSE